VEVPLQRDFPAVAASLVSVRAAVGAFAEQAGASAQLTSCAVQAVHEAAANAIVHGYAGGEDAEHFSVRGANGDGWLRFTVSDHGAGFRPSRTSPGYGLGLAIIAQLADELEIRDAEGGGIVVLITFRFDH
jgi:anti-sigma regulatory factor (Ser/Thr protein kinase)